MANIWKTTTQIEYRSLSKFQKEFYFGKNGNGVGIRYINNRRIFGWNNTTEIRMNVEKGEDNKHYYDINKRFSFLIGMYMITKTPNIKVAEVYKNTVSIRMTPNLMHHIHGTSVFSSGDGVFQTITPKFLDDYRQVYVKDRKQYDKKKRPLQKNRHITRHNHCQ